MREIITEWSTPLGRDGLSVMYFDETIPIASQRAALGVLWESIGAFQPTDTGYEVQLSGRTVDEATGALTGSWSAVTPVFGSGNASGGTQVADSTQLLIRWNTGVVRNGRFVKGRQYIPGMTAGVILDGEVNSTAVTDIAGYAQVFLDADTGFGIWSRPKEGSPGAHTLADSATVWNELAVLRARR